MQETHSTEPIEGTGREDSEVSTLAILKVKVKKHWLRTIIALISTGAAIVGALIVNDRVH